MGYPEMLVPALTSCPYGSPQGVRTPSLPSRGSSSSAFLGLCRGCPSVTQPFPAHGGCRECVGETPYEMRCCSCRALGGEGMGDLWAACGVSTQPGVVALQVLQPQLLTQGGLCWCVVPALAPNTACRGDPRFVLCLMMVPGSQGRLLMSLLPGHGSFQGLDLDLQFKASGAGLWAFRPCTAAVGSAKPRSAQLQVCLVPELALACCRNRDGFPDLH